MAWTSPPLGAARGSQLQSGRVRRRPVPVGQEHELSELRRRPGDVHMGVAPGPDLGVEAQVLVTHVVAAEPGLQAVDDHALPVVPEVELEPVALSLGGVELRVLHPCRPELVEVGTRKAGASDLVVEEEDVDASLHAVDHRGLEPPAQIVVVHDVELHQRVSPGARQTGEDAVEGRLPVHQELDVVASEERRVGELLQGLVVRQALDRRDLEGLERLAHLGGERIDFFLVTLPGLPIALELAAPEHPVERNREVREGVEAHPPGDRPLGGAVGHDRVGGADEPEDVEDDDQHAQHAKPPGTPGSLPRNDVRVHGLTSNPASERATCGHAARLPGGPRGAVDPWEALLLTRGSGPL